NNSSNGYASYGGVLGISACTDQELLASYSCFGPSIDLCAPSNGGINQLTTTDRLGGKGYSSGSYTNMFGGTSGASPIAAGVAALVYAANPDLSRWEAMVALLSTAQKIDAVGGQYDNKGHSPKYGYGRVDAAQAVRLATRIDSISISGSAIGQVGGTVDIHLQAGPANGMWSLFYSRTLAGNQGPGGTLAPGLIHPLDLGGRPAYAATGSFDAQGNASWTSIPLPSSLAGTTVYVEAVGTDSSGLRYDSAAHEVVVQ
ncbi:MAG: S8 family serine peptidase, partial [Planctomycetes bacterium]|nr:S8 family serine peptidase [Planctomycetota bacterium]